MPNQNFIPAFPLRLKESIKSNPNQSKISARASETDAQELSQNYKFHHLNNKMTKCIHHLNWINCFIGANNSGKSRALRAMFKCIIPQNVIPFKLPNLNLVPKQVTIIHALLNLNVSIDENIKDLITPSFYIYSNYAQIYNFWKRLEALLLNNEAILNFATKLVLDNKIIPIEEFASTYRRYFDKIDELNAIKKDVSTLNIKLKSLIEAKNRVATLKEDISKREDLLLYKAIRDDSTKLEKLNANLLNIVNNISTIKKQINTTSTPVGKKQLEERLKLFKTREARLKKEISQFNEINRDELPQLIAELEALNLPALDQLESDLKPLNLSNIEKGILNIKLRLTEYDETKIPKSESEIGEAHELLQAKIGNKLKEEINLVLTEGIKTIEEFELNKHKLYIPILRGTRPFDLNNADVYAERTEKDYNIDAVNIFTGLSFYTELQRHLLGTHAKRELIRDFEKFLSKSFFDNQEVVLIPNIDSDVVYIKIGNKEHPIYDLGDGVQALIVLTFPLFLRKEEEWAIFIEEPEAHLHPKWQRFFITTIKKYFPNHQFFITSHSNVFLNTEDVSVYRVTQDSTDGKTAIEYIDTQHTELLDDLGYKASDLLSANYIIWVEGASDKIYIKQFISAYDDTLIEGIHYSIMFYGGCSNLVEHIDVSNTIDTDKINILALNPKCGFIVDSDLKNASIRLEIDKNGKKKFVFQQACIKAGCLCWITKTREIENLIPEEVWKEAAIQHIYTRREKYKDLVNDISQVTFDCPITDLNFNNRTGDEKGTKVSLSDGTIVRIDDKIKMAKEVVKLFPKNKTDLSSVPELEENIARLVEEIKKANLVEATMEEEDKQDS